MHNFFKGLTQGSHDSRILLYHDMFYTRCNQVVSNAFPIFTSIVNKSELKESILQFMKSGHSKSKMLWKMPEEYRLFVKKYKLISLKCADDLMWYEFDEIKIFMRDLSSVSPCKFTWENKYDIGNNANIKALGYKIYEGEYEKRYKNYVISYIEMVSDQHFCREISEFLYKFIKMIKCSNALECLDILSNEYEINEDIKNVLFNSMNELCELGILRPFNVRGSRQKVKTK